VAGVTSAGGAASGNTLSATVFAASSIVATTVEAAPVTYVRGSTPKVVAIQECCSSVGMIGLGSSVAPRQIKDFLT
jgi:hypothetical protein